MTFIRTDQQAALNNLLVAVRETNDHYRDSAEIIHEENIKKTLRNIARQREPFLTRLEEAVRAVGDLPAVPDPDREAGAMLLHHVTALIKDDYIDDVVTQRLEGEKNLSAIVAEGQKTSLSAPHQNLLNDISHNIRRAIEQLQSMRKVTSE